MELVELQKMFADFLIKQENISTPQFEWSKEKEEEFDRIPIETLLDDKYFLGLKEELYPVHREDIIEFFERKERGEDLRLFLDSEAIRSGKTFKAAVMLWIMVFKNIIRYDLHEYYPTVGKNYGLAFLCASRDLEKSKDVTFEKVLPLFLNSGFFIDYFPPDVTMQEVKEMKRKPDRLRFPNRMLLFTNSGMLGELGALGYDLIYAVLDEINFFPMVKQSRRSVANIEGTFDAADELLTSVLTRIGAQFVIDGKLVPYAGVHALSARRGKNDFLSRKTVEYRSDPSVMIRDRKLWEAKPAAWKGRQIWCGKMFEFDTETLRCVNLREALRMYREQFGVDLMGINLEEYTDAIKED